jgi:hypothetical protein
LKNGILLFFGLLNFFVSGAQVGDSSIVWEGKQVTLSPIVIRRGTNVPGFIRKVEDDTTFYKAFKNLRVLNFSSLNDIRMLDKKGRVESSLYSKTRQWAKRGCRVTNVIEEKTTGDFYDRKGDYNYYTAELYAFFERYCLRTNQCDQGYESFDQREKGFGKEQGAIEDVVFQSRERYTRNSIDGRQGEGFRQSTCRTL